MKVYKALVKKEDSLWDILTEQSLGDLNLASEKEKFDFYIKKSFIEGNPFLPNLKVDSNSNNFGFYIRRFNRYYDRYISENVNLKDKLSPYILDRYNRGKGNEFKTGKFYSVASSSRFAVASFSENLNGIVQLLDAIQINSKECKLHKITL